MFIISTVNMGVNEVKMSDLCDLSKEICVLLTFFQMLYEIDISELFKHVTGNLQF